MDADRRGVLKGLAALFAAPKLISPIQTSEDKSAAIKPLPPAAVDENLPPLSDAARARVTVLGKLGIGNETAATVSVLQKNPLNEYWEYVNRAIAAKDYNGVLKPLGPQLVAFYKEDIGIFRNYYNALKAFYNDKEGQGEIAADVKEINKLLTIRNTFKNNWELKNALEDVRNAKVRDLAQQQHVAISEALEALRIKWGVADTESLLNLAESYKFITTGASWSHENDPGMAKITDRVEYFLYKAIHHRLWEHLNTQPYGAGDIKGELIDEMYCQYADMIFATLTGKTGNRNHLHSAGFDTRLYYSHRTADIPNFFESEGNAAQKEAHHQRNTTISLRELRPLGLIGIEADRLRDIYVPLIRGLNENEKDAYFMEAAKRLVPDRVADYEQQIHRFREDNWNLKLPKGKRVLKGKIETFQATLSEFLTQVAEKTVINAVITEPKVKTGTNAKGKSQTAEEPAAGATGATAAESQTDTPLLGNESGIAMQDLTPREKILAKKPADKWVKEKGDPKTPDGRSGGR